MHLKWKNLKIVNKQNTLVTNVKLVIILLWAILFSLSVTSENGSVNFTSSNLPIIKIDTNGKTISDNERIVATMGIISNDNSDLNYVTDPANDYDGRIAIELHGQSSLGFPKKSYRIETQDSSGENANVSLLGMPKENDWILYAPYSDKTLMRNFLVYTLAAEMGEYAPRVQFCELTLNGDYRGVYILTEKIKRDKNRVDITKMSLTDSTEPNISGGYIFKEDKTDPGDNIIWLSRGLQLVITEPKNDEISSAQTDWLTNYLNGFENVLYSGGNYNEYIDISSFVDNFLIVEFTKNIDGFRLSTYFYKDRNEKIVAAPVWDYNLSLGNADYDDGWTPIGWYYPLITWDKNWWEELVKDPNFWDLCKTRWQELRINQFDKAAILSKVDQWVTSLENAQERNFTRYPILGIYIWPNPGYPQSGSFGFDAPKSGAPTTWPGEIDSMKSFIIRRLDWMDEQLGVTISGLTPNKPNSNNLFHLYQNYPNPFNASTRISFVLQSPGDVELKIYDLAGRVMKTLLKQTQKPRGDYSIEFDASDLPSGIYIFKLKSGTYEQSHKMILLK